MRRFLVTGASGQLGRELFDTVPGGFHCVGLDRSALDITSAEAIASVLSQHRPDAVINAAAYTAVDRAESDRDTAYAVNDTAVGLLAQACLSHRIRLLHVSTDFVFSGAAGSPYHPAAPTGPGGVYGASKLAGEARLRSCDSSGLILRTGWVYSRHGGNFVRTMLRLMAEKNELGVVADQVGTPTWARGLAAALWSFAGKPELSGVYHWSDAGVCSWYDFAIAIAEEAFSLGLLSRMPAIRPIATADYPTAARRPAYSVLDKHDTWRDLGNHSVHWRQQLRLMLQDLGEHA